MSARDSASDLELLRDYVDGVLDPGARASFEARLRDDAGFASLVEAYAVARDATEDAIDPPRTRFADLRLTEEIPVGTPHAPRPWWPRLAAAAILLLALVVGWRVTRPGDAQAPHGARASVALHAIPLAALPEPASRPDWPHELLTDRLLDEEGHLVWRRDLASASRVAHALGRPVLLFVEHETCPYCKAYDADVFTDRVVAHAADPFVLVRLFWNECPPALMRDPAKGWPLFHLLDSDEQRLGGFENFHDAHAFVERLDELHRIARDSGRFPERDRERVRSIARRLDQAEHAATIAARSTDLRAVAEADPEGDLGAVARARLEELRRRAQAALFRARDTAPDRARALLDEAAGEFEGTPYGADLLRVRNALEETGEFPLLEEDA